MSTNATQKESPEISKKNLHEAIENAKILLAFSSKNGLCIDKGIIERIVKSQNSNDLSIEDEIDFWMQYSYLVQSVLPTTAESIRAMTCKEFLGITKIKWIVSLYTFVTIVIFLILLSLQAYLTIGNFIVTDIKERRIQSQQIEDNLYRYRNEMVINEKFNSQLNVSEIKKLEIEKRNLAFYITSNYAWLKKWNSLFHNTGDDDSDPDKIIENNISIIQSSVVSLEIIQIYILPLLYGLLGTCVYILRDLSLKAKNNSFTQISTINFHIRLCLGALGGITSAWFIVSGKSPEGIMSLSPFALAFITGYSIEILFSAMDTFIGAFTGKKFVTTPKSEK